MKLKEKLKKREKERIDERSKLKNFSKFRLN